MEEFLTACPRNCYSTCTFRVQVENNTIKRILPYRENLATPEGPCIKGLAYIEQSNSPKRIIHPLIRKPDGTFEQITADEALRVAAMKLEEIRTKYGSQSILCEILCIAKITNRLPAGCVVLPNGIWLDEGGGGNKLTGPLETDMGYGAAYHDARVEVERAD